MKFAFRFFLLLLPLALTGCWFQNPLTTGGSENLNTWLIGEWQHKDKKGVVTRAVVSPVSDDMYRVQVTQGGRTSHEFEAWSSRVGNSVFLTMRSVRNSPNVPEGAHLFALPQLLDQKTVRMHPLKLDSPADASGLQLRREIRTKLKDGSLYAEAEATEWKRIGEVWWSRDGQAGVFEPVRYEAPPPKEKRTQLGNEIP